ncbi:hypothetical protein CGSHi7P49H1_08690 [Haemophilus influenzae 7P49H1]|nr:hypothetical protein CGSHi7P49H1_08690 [Haemophilus influenzae 7P49H1]
MIGKKRRTGKPKKFLNNVSLCAVHYRDFQIPCKYFFVKIFKKMIF